MKKQTFSDRLINEGDLKSQGHDDLMISLNSNIKRFIITLWDRQWNRGSVWLRKKYPLAQCPEKPDPDPNIKLAWEVPITMTTGRGDDVVVGFMDMAVLIDKWPIIDYDSHAERPIIYEDTREVFVEVKTKIVSLGELIRQLKLYRQYQARGDFVVMSPDVRFKEVLEEQGFWFIEPREFVAQKGE